MKVGKRLIHSERFAAEAKFVRLHRYQAADVVMCYVSVKDEADTWWLLKTILQDGKKPAVPRVDGDKMEFYLLRDLNELEPGKFGIFEPLQQCPIYTPGNNELMAVPGVRFDENCNRKGHGRGYYDKYFGKYGRERFFKVALTMESCVEEALSDIQPHDVPMDLILTEKRAIERARCAVGV